MYIKRKQLWWLFPIFCGLFILGVLLAKLTGPTQPVSIITKPFASEQTTEQYARAGVAALIKQLTLDSSVHYVMETRNQEYQGTFRKEAFDISGQVSGHTITMQRTNETLRLQVDGKDEDAEFLPYSLFTPYEHAMVIQSRLSSITPRVIANRTSSGLQGFQFALPADEVKEMLSLWLGPQFRADDVMKEYVKDVVIRYELWYDTNNQRMKELHVDLEVNQLQKPKHDQLIFRFS